MLCLKVAMRRANSPSTQTPSVTGNSDLGNLAVLLVSFPQVVLIGLEHHVADKQTVAGLLAGVARFCCSTISTMSLLESGKTLCIDTLLEANVGS